MSEALSCVDNTCPKEFLWKVLKNIFFHNNFITFKNIDINFYLLDVFIQRVFGNLSSR